MGAGNALVPVPPRPPAPAVPRQYALVILVVIPLVVVVLEELLEALGLALALLLAAALALLLLVVVLGLAPLAALPRAQPLLVRRLLLARLQHARLIVTPRTTSGIVINRYVNEITTAH